jgi:hypothetical protein
MPVEADPPLATVRAAATFRRYFGLAQTYCIPGGNVAPGDE